MLTELYPLKFEPIFKERIWGGNKLKSILNKQIPSSQIGESWEISAVKGDVSIVSNGPLKGQHLSDLVQQYKADLLGEKNFNRFGDKFPLLIKFIDAKKDLSIQLHPNDQLAKERHDSFGKTEMWYVMQAEENAQLIVGFNTKVTKDSYLKHVREKSLTEILNFDQVKKGDTYFIEVGRIHAIGAGVLLAEIQQTSDVTYRIYDWDRVDDQGNARDLHNDLAIDAIDFDMKNNFKKDYQSINNISNQMVKCPYFTTNFIPLTGSVIKHNPHDSFIIYMCMDGRVALQLSNETTFIDKGDTVLVPASISTFKLYSEKAELLEVYV